MKRRHRPGWTWARTCPNCFDLPAGPPWPLRVVAAPDRTAPVAVPDPSPSGLTPGRGGTTFHPY